MENIELPEFDEIVFQESTETTVDTTVDNDNVNDDSVVITEEKEADDTTTDTADTEEHSYDPNADPVAIATFDQLVEEGIFDETDRKAFDGTWDSMKNGLASLPQKVLNGLFAQAPDITKDVVRFAFSSPDITKDDLIKFTKTYLEEIDNPEVTLETMDDARSYLQTLYEQRGLKPRAAEAIIQSLEEDSTLLEEAQEEYEKEKELKSQRPKTEKLIADKENEYNQKIEAQTRFASSLSEELNSTGWKQSKIDGVKQRLNNINPILTEAFKSPKALIKLVDFLGYYKNGDIDFTKFIESLETNSARDLKNKMQAALSSPTLTTKSNLKNPQEQDQLKPVI